MSRLEALRAQIEELEAVESVYPEALVLDASERELLALARSAADACTSESLDWLPELGGQLRCQGSVREASIHFSLPPLYLSAAHPAKLTVDCSAPREVQDQLLHELRGRAAEWDGAPCLLLAIDWLQGQLQRLEQQQPPEAEQLQGSNQAPVDPQSCTSSAATGNRERAPVVDGAQKQQQQEQQPEQRLMRAAVWFHHIKSTAKRKNILEWARELDVRGASKPGFPGVVICEGLEPNVREYLSRIRSLKWQAMQLRAQQLLPLFDQQHRQQGQRQPQQQQGQQQQQGGQQRFEGPLCELPETGMSELGLMCRTAGAEELFMAVLKL